MLTVYFYNACSSPEGELFIAEPEDLCRTEILEYALGLSRTDFNLPSFQKHKLFHAIKLFESGLLEKVHVHACTSTHLSHSMFVHVPILPFIIH